LFCFIEGGEAEKSNHSLTSNIVMLLSYWWSFVESQASSLQQNHNNSFGDNMSEHQESDGKAVSGSPAKKRSCPVTKAEFVASAAPLSVIVDGRPSLAKARVFSTGSFGWHLGQRLSIKIGEKDVDAVCTVLCTVLGSRGAARE
jgi:hypothetical protein